MSVSTIINHKQELKKLFFNHFQEDAISVEQLPQSGSDRIYFLLKSEKNEAIGAYNPDLQENRTFFYFSELFHKYKIAVPELYEKENNKGHYLVEYKEGISLLELLQKEGYTDYVKGIYKKCMEELVRIQTSVLQEMDFSMCFGAEEFDQSQIFSDLMYFKYYFLDMHKVNYAKQVLQEEFGEMAKNMAAVRPQTFMYRDFQARNIIVNERGEPSFIDYQGGMKGVPQYDVVSILWQARAELPEDWKRELFNHYFTCLQENGQFYNLNEIEFRKTYLDCIVLRVLQTLGAYGFRGLIEGREHFLKSIAPALKQLKIFIDEHPRHPSFPELRNVLEQLTSGAIYNKYTVDTTKKYSNTDKLKVNIYSFSFKKGTAKDVSGNGGGFVFDCRGILNPGRLEPYKTQTGMDKDVQDYLETQTLMPDFISQIHKVIDVNIENFLERGFENMDISFGCTGGQHRSVYAAEATKKHLKNKYGIEQVTVLHLEQSENDKERTFGGTI